MPPKNIDVIVERLDGFRNLFEEQLKAVNEKLSSIETQTKLTNGRVNTLEGKVAKIIGGLILLSALVGILEFLLKKL